MDELILSGEVAGESVGSLETFEGWTLGPIPSEYIYFHGGNAEGNIVLGGYGGGKCLELRNLTASPDFDWIYVVLPTPEPIKDILRCTFFMKFDEFRDFDGIGFCDVNGFGLYWYSVNSAGEISCPGTIEFGTLTAGVWQKYEISINRPLNLAVIDIDDGAIHYEVALDVGWTSDPSTLIEGFLFYIMGEIIPHSVRLDDLFLGYSTLAMNEIVLKGE